VSRLRKTEETGQTVTEIRHQGLTNDRQDEADEAD